MRIENGDNPDVRKVGELMSVFLHQSWPKDDVTEEKLLKHILLWKPMENYLDFFSMFVNDVIKKVPNGKIHWPYRPCRADEHSF